MKIHDGRTIEVTEPANDHAQAVIESRVFFRRRLAERITLEVLRLSEGHPENHHINAAQFIEDLANAVAERVAAREDQELRLVRMGIT